MDKEELECSCGWVGTESELEIDYYESHTSSMPLSDSCPNCGSYVE